VQFFLLKNQKASAVARACQKLHEQNARRKSSRNPNYLTSVQHKRRYTGESPYRISDAKHEPLNDKGKKHPQIMNLRWKFEDK
jgi:hypothetical protein